jgi:hypothetical protein
LGLGEEYLFPVDVRKQLEAEFLTPPSTLPNSVLQKAIQVPNVQVDPNQFIVHEFLKSRLEFQFDRDPITGAVIGYTEVPWFSFVHIRII